MNVANIVIGKINLMREQGIGVFRNSSRPVEQLIKLRGDGIANTHHHDAGAYARCSYCGRYSDNPDSLIKDEHPCDCGKLHGWCGSFKKPTIESKWSEAT